MAQKESRHREVVEDLTEQLSHVRRQLDDLSKLSRDQVSSFRPAVDLMLITRTGSQHVHRARGFTSRTGSGTC